LLENLLGIDVLPRLYPSCTTSLKSTSGISYELSREQIYLKKTDLICN